MKNNDLFLPTIVQAGAGAGKTTELVERVFLVVKAFQEKENRLPRLVVCTFTRKATQELRTRLIEEAIRRGEDEMLEYVSSKTSLHISTIHGILGSFLSRYGHHLGIDPSFEILNSQDSFWQTKRVLKKIVFSKEEYVDLLQSHNFDELALFCTNYLSKKELYPDLSSATHEDMKNVAFKKLNAIVDDGVELANDIEAESQNEKWLTFAGYLRQLKTIVKNQNVDSVKTGIDTWYEVLPKKPSFSQKAPPVTEETNENLAEWLKVLSTFIEANYLNKNNWFEFEKLFEKLKKLGDEFIQSIWLEKSQTGKVTMEDLELMSNRLATERKDLLYLFSQEWDYWFIDEYQDTSPMQKKILEQLIGDRPNYQVGDPQQSIYLFRGSRKEVFAGRKEEVIRSHGVFREKRKNYRSHPSTLLFFNDFFRPLGFVNMEPNLNEIQKIEPSKLVAEFVCAFDKETEYEYIASKVIHLLNQGVKPSQICILTRVNQSCVDIAETLSNYNVPTMVDSSGGFIDRREILDALSILKFLVVPHDDKNWIQLCRSPWFRVNDSVLAQIAQNVKKSNIDKQWQSQWSEAQKNFSHHESIATLIALHDRALQKGVSFAFQEALVQSGLFDLSHHHDVTGRREANLWKLLVRLKTEEHRSGFNYLSFVEQNSALQTDESSDGDAVAASTAERVTLMTIHHAKGLQFDHVIIPNFSSEPNLKRRKEFCVDEKTQKWSYPLTNSEGEKANSIFADEIQEKKIESEKEESDRVLYVAFTRAKQTVTVTWHPKQSKNSWLNRIRWNMTPGLIENQNYSYEVKSITEKPKISKYESSGEAALVRAKWQGDNIIKQIKRQSVTSLLASVFEKRVHQKGNENNIDVFVKLKTSVRGTWLHRVFENIERVDQKTLQQWFADEASAVQSAIDFLLNYKEIPVKEILNVGFREWGFIFRHQDRTVEGQIDIWAKYNDIIYIVDYKTGSSRYVAKAFEQLKIYSLALRKMGMKEKIILVAAFPFEQKIMSEIAPDEKKIIETYF